MMNHGPRRVDRQWEKGRNDGEIVYRQVRYVNHVYGGVISTICEAEYFALVLSGDIDDGDTYIPSDFDRIGDV